MEAAVQCVEPSVGVFAPDRLVTRLSDCEFYHTQEVPGYGLIRGVWDLRGHVDSYLGGVDLRGKRVLEMGTASGFLCMEMEKRGAEVVAFDLSEDFDGDLVPFTGHQFSTRMEDRRAFVRRLNDGWWLVHQANRSNTRVVYGNAYDVPAEIGPVDVATFGCILMHLRDPYRALESAASLVRETIIVTEPTVHWDQFPPPESRFPVGSSSGQGKLSRFVSRLLRWKWWPGGRLRERVRRAESTLRAVLDGPAMLFLPNARDREQNQAWWAFRPQVIVAMLGTLGFTRTTISTTDGALLNGKPERLFTVVAHRG